MKKDISLLMLTLLINLSALSQPGSPDNGFGTNGRVNFPIGIYDDHAYAIAIQTDGKIVIAGPSRILVNDPNFGNRNDFAVARLNPDGSPDNNFGGGDGKVIITVGDFGSFAHAVKIQPDGKILVAGYALNTNDLFADYAVVRLEADGDPDPGFDGDGIAYISISPQHDLCYAMALQTDGKIVLAGESNALTGGRVFSVARLTPTGGPDPTFNSGGSLLINISNISSEAASSVAIQPDGKIVVAGQGSTSNPELAHFAVVRLTETGSMDPGFNSTGELVLLTGNSSFCRAMVLQPDGKILLAGGSGFLATTADFQIVRLESNGSYDNSFDSDGRVLIPVGTGIDDAYSMALQPDGKIVVAGQSQSGSSFNFSAIRLNTNGTPDVCFDTDGKVILPSLTTSGFGERNRAIALQPDGKIVLAGVNGNTNTNPADPAIDFIVMRIHGGSGTAQDLDGDGYSACVDCDDNNPNINPGATEICNGSDDDCDGLIDEGVQSIFYRDFDADGYGNLADTVHACTLSAGYVTNSTDCNDNNAAIHPGATEVCNTVDDDCDGLIDEGLPQFTFYRDVDTDGYGTPSITTMACSAPGGYVSNSTDCNDNNAAIHPGATEVCNTVDDDCDGLIDEGVQSTFYRDVDVDGYGTPSITTQACSAPAGYVSNSTDCNDNNAAIHPGATEVCNTVDDDCDGEVDEGCSPDNDGDGYTIPQGDCNDNDPAIHPGATEICNNVDDDCDGQIDEGVTPPTWYADSDGDGYGRLFFIQVSCTQPPGYAPVFGDCDDTDPAIHPGATEICNNVDDDCDGQIDEGVTPPTWYADSDGDGYGRLFFILVSCTQPAGYAPVFGDCDDTDPAIHPGATEVCNNVDDDCDGQIDEGVTPPTWYADSDGDGYGRFPFLLVSCTQPAGYAPVFGDCDDTDPAIHPGATEVCNNVDDDCDGQIDEGVEPTTWWADSDGDGYGRFPFLLVSCTQPAGYAPVLGDCDDTDPAIHPGATEVCNNTDDDCDGLIDESGQSIFYRDFDVDGYGNPAVTVQECTAPAGYVSNSTDCNDNNSLIHPGATEICGNGVDENCNGQVDENTAVAIIVPAGEVSLCSGSDLLLSANNGTGLSYQWFRNNIALAGQTAATITVNIGGNYSVRVTNSGNCVVTSQATAVTPVNTPKAGISIQGGGNNCPVNMQAHPGGPVTYQWYKDNILLPGATQRNYSASTSGSYTVTVTKDGCPGVSSPVIVSSCPQNRQGEYTKPITEPLYVPGRLNIYPNPASENSMVELILDEKTSGEAIVQLTTLSGNVLTSQKTVVVNGRMLYTIQLSQLWRDNLYIVKVNTGKQVFTARLLILRF